MIIDISLLTFSMLSATFLQVEEPVEYLVDCGKLFILGVLLTQYPLAVIGSILITYSREFVKKILQQPKPVIISPPLFKEFQILASQSQHGQQVEAVQIFDYTTGVSQYAFLQKAERSLLAQLGVTLKHTVLLERGRMQEHSIQKSKLLSHIEGGQATKRAAQIEIIYEDESEFTRNQNQQHVSIPFKTQEFDRQMGEIVQHEILSTDCVGEEQENRVSIEDLVFGCVTSLAIGQISSDWQRMIVIVCGAIIYHKGIYREQLLTLTHALICILSISLMGIGYFIGIYWNVKELVWGCLLYLIIDINPNIQVLVLPIPLLLTCLGI